MLSVHVLFYCACAHDSITSAAVLMFVLVLISRSVILFYFTLFYLIRKVTSGCKRFCTPDVEECRVVKWRKHSVNYLFAPQRRVVSRYICDHGARWLWVASFTVLLLYLRGKWHRYPLERKLGGFHTRSRRFREDRNVLLPGFESGLSGYRAYFTDDAMPIHTKTLGSYYKCNGLFVF
jgi:hypothetical protein